MIPLNEDLLRVSRRFDAAGRPPTLDEAHRLAWALQCNQSQARPRTALRATAIELCCTVSAALRRTLRARITAAR